MIITASEKGFNVKNYYHVSSQMWLSFILWNHGNQKCAENVTGNFPGKNFEFSQKLFLTQFWVFLRCSGYFWIFIPYMLYDLGYMQLQERIQSNANHPLAESMGYIKFEGM